MGKGGGDVGTDKEASVVALVEGATEATVGVSFAEEDTAGVLSFSAFAGMMLEVASVL